MGSAMACFESAKEYALSRVQFKKPIAGYQLVQNKLAFMLREITKGQLLALHLGQMKDDGSWFPEQVSLAKMNNVDAALQIARMSRDIHGANGILDEYPIMRHMANLESVYTYEGTHDIHNLIFGSLDYRASGLYLMPQDPVSNTSAISIPMMMAVGL